MKDKELRKLIGSRAKQRRLELNLTQPYVAEKMGVTAVSYTHLPHRNSIDVYTSAGYMLRIDCWEAEKNLKTTPGSDCALNALAIDEPLEYARLYLDGCLLYTSRCV